MHPRCSWIFVFAAFAFLGVSVSANGHDPFDPVDLGWEALDKNDWATALARFNEAIRADPRSDEAHRGRGVAYGMKGNFDLAIAEANKAIELDPKNPGTYRSRGGIYLYKGDYDRAIADYNEAIRGDPNVAAAYNNRGGAYLYKGNLERAINDLDEAIRLDSKDAGAYSNRGYAYCCQGHLDKAITDLTEAVRLDPKSAQPYGIRGLAWEAKGEYKKAIADLGESLRLCPKDAATYCLRGRVWAARGMFDRAIADFDEALRLDATDATTYRLRGRALAERGMLDRAIADLDAAIRLAPKDAEAFRVRSAAYYYNGESDKALVDINEAIRLDPKASKFYLTRALIFADKGEIEREAADYAEAIRLAPNDAEAYLHRGDWLVKRHAFDEARADFDQAIKLDPKSPSAYEARGALWISRNDFERGLADLATALRLNPADPAARFEPWPKHVASPEARKHGEQQLRRMLHDRPAMAQYGSKAAVLYDWAIGKFAGEDLGHKIFWDASDPPPSAMACNEQATADSPGLIRVREKHNNGPEKDKKQSFEELWVCAVFELYNVTKSEYFRQVTKEAEGRNLSKEEFVTKIVEGESRAAEKTRAFALRVYLPWAKQNRVPADPSNWFIGHHLTARQNVYQNCVESDPYWQAYARRYDLIRLASLVHQGNDEGVIELAAEMRKHAETPEERAEICAMSGYSLLALGKPWRAIDDLNESLRQDSKNVDVLMLRARAYCMVQDLSHALADCCETIRLDSSCADAFFLRAKIYEAMGDKKHAAADLATAKRLPQPRKPGVRHSLRRGGGDPLEAAHSLDKRWDNWSDFVLDKKEEKETKPKDPLQPKEGDPSGSLNKWLGDHGMKFERYSTRAR
jgi:tetratricopeptide (TPR) repeat protein